jgi:molybdenum cofactor guanylyltransferase
VALARQNGGAIGFALIFLLTPERSRRVVSRQKVKKKLYYSCNLEKGIFPCNLAMIEKSNFINTYGLVLCGGKSSRMGNDKSMLQYYEKPQRYHVYDMLLPFCEKVFISCNAEQVNSIAGGYGFIEDNALYGDNGPMAALLTSFSKYPAKDLLLIGCDYPFLTAGDLQLFSTHCKNIPAAFYNEADDVYEPMLAWYPYSYFDKLKTMFTENQFSLQHFLKDVHATKYLPVNTNTIKSIDTNEDLLEVLKHIRT